MELREIDDQKTWDAFIVQQPWTQFLQSWGWGAFQQTQGREVKRFFLCDPDPVMAVQFIRYTRRLGIGYWFAPRGPVFLETVKPRARELMDFLSATITCRHLLYGKTLFIRCEPSLIAREGEAALPLAFRRAHSMNPAVTIRMDLRQDEATLLANMHPKTRYNLRVAERHGVSVREGGNDDIETFLRLTQETAVRDRIQTHSLSYLRATYEELSKRGMARLRLAEYGGNVLAINMEITCGDTVTYLHGASSAISRQVMAPTFLQWEAIKVAKGEGYVWYDFAGCNPSRISSYYYKPSWEGITRFKQGFGGTLVELPGTWDLPVHPFVYKLFFPERFKRER